MNRYEAVLSSGQTTQYMTVSSQNYEDAVKYFELRLPNGYKIVQIRQIIGTGTTESSLQFD